MFRGVYAATSGMIAADRRQQMLTNNIANANTAGYKADQTVNRSFPEQLLQRIRDEKGLNVQGTPSFAGSSKIGRLSTGVYAQEAIPMFTAGPLKETGRKLDVALIDQGLVPNPETGKQGHLFFAVNTGDGEIRYTRNGQFTHDANGYLTTGEGYQVLDSNMNPIYVGGDNFRVNEDGSIQLNDTDNPNAQQLFLGYTEDPTCLVKQGNGVLKYVGNDGEGRPIPLADVEHLQNAGQLPAVVKQGFIEGSNVDVTRTMTDMMTTFRMYEANQKVLQAYDRSMEKAANEVGKLY